jgi:transcriptional regulator with XRE-family HTH domain
MPTPTMTFGALLRQRRQALGLTQQELARKVGSHQPVIGAWELGRSAPTPEQLARLAKALGMPLAELQAAEMPRRGRKTSWLPGRVFRLRA